MKMRLKPLRGQMCESTEGPVKFLEQVADDHCKVLFNDALHIISMAQLDLPIIDTKDYEKIPDEKYKGD